MTARTGTPSKLFLADTMALVVFFTATGILNERFVAGMEWEAVIASRAIGAPLMVLTARPYGIWRDWVMRRAGATGGGVRSLFWDATALVTFQIPIYAAILLAGGAGWMEMLRGCAGFAVIVLVSGRPYGLWLDLVRRALGVTAVERDVRTVKPMSLDD